MGASQTPFFLKIMAKEFSRNFYNSKQWKEVRASYISSRFGLCERCGCANARQVHHKIYLTPDNINKPDITIDFNNLELLCDTCHQNEHHKVTGITEDGLLFDSNGNLIQTLPPNQKNEKCFSRPTPHKQGKYCED